MRRNKGTKVIQVLFLASLLFGGCSQLHDRPPKVWNVKDKKALGDGKSDDTRAIQAVIDNAAKGDTVFIPEGVYPVISLALKSGVHLKSTGTLKQIGDNTEEYSDAHQNSTRPLLKIEEVSDIYLSVNAESQNEAIRLIKSKNITIEHSNLKGDSTKLRSFSGILLFECSNITMNNLSISNYGRPRADTHKYQPGTGIRILSCNDVNVTGSSIKANAQNGVFIHGSYKIDVSNNHFNDNGMSAIQVAFGSTGVEKDYTFVNNTMEYNAADAIDINNRSSKAFLDINCLIKDNTSLNNGFVDGQSTPDGSGIATLVNVSGVKMVNNTAQGNNRPAIYMEDCGNIYGEYNKADNGVEIVKNLDNVTLHSNEFGSVTLLSNVVAKKITLEDNKLKVIHLPHDITVDSLFIRYNEVSSATFNFNLTGNAWLVGNQISNRAERVTIMITRASSLYIKENKINSSKSTAILVKRSAKNVTIEGNDIQSANACIDDEGSHKLLVSTNKLTSLAGGKTRYTLLSHHPNELKLMNNEHVGATNYVALLLEGEGKAHLESEKILQGKKDLGRVDVTRVNFD